MVKQSFVSYVIRRHDLFIFQGGKRAQQEKKTVFLLKAGQGSSVSNDHDKKEKHDDHDE